jgi:hypothetical protein
MKWLRIGLLSLLLLPVLAQAQPAPIGGFCINGAKPAITSGLPSSNYNQNLIPRCTVAVVLHGTTTPATIYSDANQTPLTNPFTANTDASWQFYVVVAGTPGQPAQAYDVTLSGGIAPNTYNPPRTLVGLFPAGSGGGGGSPPAAPVDSYQFNKDGVTLGGSADATYNPATGVSGFKGVDLTTSVLQGRDDVIDVFSDLGCDPTGATECTAALQSGITAHPNGTFLFPVPQGSTSATYLLAGTANLTLPSSITLRFQNGAMISTGHGTAGTITSIYRTGYNQAPRVVSVAGCTSAVTTVGFEAFTNCPTNVQYNSIAVFNGLTHVPNCYKGCIVSTLTYNSFNVVNPAATSLIVAGPETGTMTDHDSTLQQGGDNPAVTIATTPSTITVVMPNTLPANLPAVVSFSAQVGSPSFIGPDPYAIIPSSITSTGFQAFCPPNFNCNNSPPTNYPTGAITINPTGYTGVSFSSNLGNMPNPTSGNGQQLGLLYCSVTTNFNGMYSILSSAANNSAILQDYRATVPTETAGSCYAPYVVTVTGMTQASTSAQIVAPGSAVTFQGQSDIYVGWYGAGQGNAATDTYGTQTALVLNPSHHIRMPKITPGAVGNAGAPDYNFTSGIALSGNAQELNGEVGTLWEGGGGTTIQCANNNEPCIVMSPAAPGAAVRNLTIYNSNCANAPYAPIQPQYDILAQDGILVGGSTDKVDYVQAGCFGRTGINLVSHASFNQTLGGTAQPDFWSVESVFLDGNQGYGFAAYGSDSNGGLMHGNNWVRGNIYGGVHSEVQLAGTYINPNGDGNSGSFGGGALINVTSLTVAGTGSSAVCTANLAGAAAGNPGIWYVVAGTNGSGGAAGTDGTWKTTNVTGSTITYSCPGASGGPATTGTVNTANYIALYTALQTYPNGDNNFTIDGLIGGPNTPLWINPYSESTNGYGEGQDGLIINGDLGEFIYQGGCDPNCYGPNPLTIFMGGGNGVYELFTRGMLLRSLPGTPTAGIEFNAPWAGSGAAFNGSMLLVFSSFQDQNFSDWIMGVYPDNIFKLQDQVDGGNVDNRTILEIDPSSNANMTTLTTPNSSGTLNLGTGGPGTTILQGGGATGFVKFFGGAINQIVTQITPNGLNWIPILTVNLPAAAANAGNMLSVSDSTAIATEGQTCAGGGTTLALAFSNGTQWKCF